MSPPPFPRDPPVTSRASRLPGADPDEGGEVLEVAADPDEGGEVLYLRSPEVPTAPPTPPGVPVPYPNRSGGEEEELSVPVATGADQALQPDHRLDTPLDDALGPPLDDLLQDPGSYDPDFDDPGSDDPDFEDPAAW